MKPRPKTVSITPVEAVEIGLDLMMAKKSVLNRSEFILRLEAFGYSISEAYRFMQAARKFHGVSNAGLLEAVATVSKLNELLMLDDDEIDTLKAGGEVQGITLASIRTMTVKELRAAIRGVSVAREPMLLTTVEALLLRAHREATRNVQDVPDKLNPAPAAAELDLFSTLPPPAPAAPVEIPLATGWHVAALQMVNPMGTWRMACAHVNQDTRYASVTFRPAPARAGYRSAKSKVLEVHHVQG